MRGDTARCMDPVAFALFFNMPAPFPLSRAVCLSLPLALSSQLAPTSKIPPPANGSVHATAPLSAGSAQRQPTYLNIIGHRWGCIEVRTGTEASIAQFGSKDIHTKRAVNFVGVERWSGNGGLHTVLSRRAWLVLVRPRFLSTCEHACEITPCRAKTCPPL